MRAVVEQHGSSTDVPPIKIMITKGRHDMTIKVASIIYLTLFQQPILPAFSITCSFLNSLTIPEFWICLIYS